MIAGTTWGWPVPSSQLLSACPSVSGEWHFLNTCVKINNSDCDQEVDVDWIHLFYHISLNTNTEVSLWCEGNKGIRRMPNTNITMPSRKKAWIHAPSGLSARPQENNFLNACSLDGVQQIRAMLCWRISKTYQGVWLPPSLSSWPV